MEKKYTDEEYKRAGELYVSTINSTLDK